MTLTSTPRNGLLPVEAERQGKLVVTTELGGGGVCPKSNHMVRDRGVATK
jgi:predicted deacylase